MRTFIIATPHERNDSMLPNIEKQLPSCRFVRIRSRDELTLAGLEQIDPERIFFPHWSWKIPAEIFSRCECVIFHMTDLPYGRGGSPLQNLIVRGHSETKLTALRCEAGLDTGPVYLKMSLSLAGSAEDILTRASNVIEKMIVHLIEQNPKPEPQLGGVTEFTRRTPADGNIAGLNQPAEAYDYIRMLDGEGYPPAFLETPALRLEFSGARNMGDFVEATVRIRKKKHD